MRPPRLYDAVVNAINAWAEGHRAYSLEREFQELEEYAFIHEGDEDDE